jgi:hypothetical protein
MHRVQSRTYVGQPNETVTVTTTLSGGGQVSVTVGGQPVVGGRFQLPGTPGVAVRLQIALVGPQGASCLVTIAVVDGSTDTDFLLCTVFDPAPVNLYDFSTAAAVAVASFGAARAATLAARGLAPAPPAPKAKAKPKTKPRQPPKGKAKRKGKAKGKGKGKAPR